jgi:hypothetical protein
MSLFWIVHEIDGKPQVFIENASSLIYARMNLTSRGVDPDTFKEAHELDGKTARKVPKAMTGRALSQREAKALLETISASRAGKRSGK